VRLANAQAVGAAESKLVLSRQAFSSVFEQRHRIPCSDGSEKRHRASIN
jgi:hypothetical protein